MAADRPWRDPGRAPRWWRDGLFIPLPAPAGTGRSRPLSGDRLPSGERHSGGLGGPCGERDLCRRVVVDGRRRTERDVERGSVHRVVLGLQWLIRRLPRRRGARQRWRRDRRRPNAECDRQPDPRVSTVTAVAISADLSTLQSDKNQRDGQLHRQALETDRFPTATFKLTQPIDLGTVPADGQVIKTTATGDLTIHGVTKSVQIPLEARLSGNVVTVTGSIDILFADYGMSRPSVVPRAHHRRPRHHGVPAPVHQGLIGPPPPAVSSLESRSPGPARGPGFRMCRARRSARLRPVRRDMGAPLGRTTVR